MRSKLGDGPSWRMAIRDAEEQIQEAKDRIKSLRGSIRFFRSKGKAGEPWPGKPPNGAPCIRCQSAGGGETPTRN